MKLFKVLDTDSVEALNVKVGDIVKLVEVSSSDNILMQCVPHRTRTTWAIPQIWFYASLLEAVHTDSEQGTLPACNEPVRPSNGEDGTLVPSEVKEAFEGASVPSTSTSHDAHYASMAVEPVTISEMMMENESIPPKARYHAAKAVEYFTRAGRKEGQDWKKEFEKALNHGYRAIHGKWPWETVDQ